MKLSQVLLAIVVLTGAFGGVFVMPVAAQEEECNQDNDQTNDDRDFTDTAANILTFFVGNGNSVAVNVLGNSSSSGDGGGTNNNNNENTERCDQDSDN